MIEQAQQDQQQGIMLIETADSRLPYKTYSLENLNIKRADSIDQLQNMIGKFKKSESTILLDCHGSHAGRLSINKTSLDIPFAFQAAGALIFVISDPHVLMYAPVLDT